MAQEIVPQQEASAEWQAQYEFWTKIIGDEVARLRWNEGFEPLECHLYEVKRGPQSGKFVGKWRICGRDFQCSVYPAHDAQGIPTLKLSVRVSPRKHH